MKKKFYIYETKKFVFVDPKNNDALYDGYSEEDSTISESDYNELQKLRGEFYSIQGAASYVDFVFGRISGIDFGNKFEITTKGDTKIEFTKKHEIEIDTSVRPNSDLISCIDRKQELDDLGCFIFGMENYDVNFDSSLTCVEDNLGGGIEIYAQSREMALVLCERIKLPDFKGWYI